MRLGPGLIARRTSMPVTTANNDLDGLLDFLRRAERLKDTVRSGYTTGGRQESVADHTWRLCLMALLLRDRFPDVDFARLVSICIVHDLGEAIGGDIPAPQQGAAGGKAEQERRDLLDLLAPLPEHQRDEIAALWDEYEAAETPEARLAKALDKLETLLQHIQGDNPPDFDYRFNLEYGRRYTEGDDTIEAIRRTLDGETARRASESHDSPA
jgi:putative hydrolase of HD superfamily